MEVYFIFLVIILCPLIPSLDAYSIFSVMAFGAVGDAKTDDSQAFMKAWAAACGAGGESSTLLIPARRTFMLKPIILKGQCRASNVYIQVEGNLVAPGDRWSYGNAKQWILIQNVNFLTIFGSGELDGRGYVWWPTHCVQDFTDEQYCKSNLFRPTLVRIESCNVVAMKGWKLMNSPRNHLLFYWCNNVYVSDITISAPGDTPNTDGINIGDSKHILITRSHIASGDDCISFLSGVSDVHVSFIECGPGHGISIGSLGTNNSEAYVSQITVEESYITNAQNGVRIKTWQGGSGYVKDVWFRHITMNSVQNPIVIDQYYFDKENKSSAVAVSNVDYFDIRGTGSKEVVVSLACSLSVPCRDIRMNQVDLQTTTFGRQASSYCLSVHGPPCLNCRPQIPCLG